MVTWFLQINLASLHSIYVGVLLFFGSARHIYFNQAWTPLDQGWQAGRPHASPSDRLPWSGMSYLPSVSLFLLYTSSSKQNLPPN